MEIADIFVVNKADQGEADQAVADIMSSRQVTKLNLLSS